MIDNFDKIDANKDGQLSRDELKAFRAANPGRFKKADLNKDGGLTKAEMEQAGMKRAVANFEKMDTNKDGKVTKEEMKAFRAANKAARAPK